MSINEKNFDEYVVQLAERTITKGGTASNPIKGEFLPAWDMWSFPKYPAKTRILAPTADLVIELRIFITANEAFLKEKGCWLGTWVNPKSGEYYLDVATGCKNLTQARRLAKKAGIEDGREIVAIFNAKKNRTIYLWKEDTP